MPKAGLCIHRQHVSDRYFRTARQQQHQGQRAHQDDGEPQWEYRPEGPSGGRVLLMRPFMWSALFTTSVFYLCSESFARHRELLRQSSLSRSGLLGWVLAGSSDADQATDLMRDPRVLQLVGWRHEVHGLSHAKALNRLANLPDWVPFELKRTVVAFVDKWHALSRSQRCVYTIVAVNTVVLGLWHIPRLLPVMAKSFLHDPRTGLSYTLLTSTFSHRDVWHFAFNNIALVSFGTIVAGAMGAEQFTAFYLSAGVISSLASHLLSPLRPALILPSLGASGAVYAVVGAAMMMAPDSKISLIFLPFVPISISHAFPALLAYDLLGALLGWQRFGHVAHLCGGLFGIAYVEWGARQWTRLVKTAEARRTKRSRDL